MMPSAELMSTELNEKKNPTCYSNLKYLLNLEQSFMDIEYLILSSL